MTGPLHIIVADDEQPMRDYLTELLPRLGHQVIATQAGSCSSQTRTRPETLPGAECR